MHVGRTAGVDEGGKFGKIIGADRGGGEGAECADGGVVDIHEAVDGAARHEDGVAGRKVQGLVTEREGEGAIHDIEGFVDFDVESRSALRAVIMRVTPSRASSFAIAFPRPWLPPVMRAVLFLRYRSILVFLIDQK